MVGGDHRHRKSKKNDKIKVSSAIKSGDSGRRRACTSARKGRGRREEEEDAYLRRRRSFSDEKLDGTATDLREKFPAIAAVLPQDFSMRGERRVLLLK